MLVDVLVSVLATLLTATLVLTGAWLLYRRQLRVAFADGARRAEERLDAKLDEIGDLLRDRVREGVRDGIREAAQNLPGELRERARSTSGMSAFEDGVGLWFGLPPRNRR